MANYPGALSTNANLYIAVNGLQTTLAAPINAVVTTISLTSTSGFPTTGLVTIENNEVVSYTGIAGATITGCTRGADGTTALSHPTGVAVGLTVVAAHHNLLKDEVIAIETALGVALANVFPATPTTGSGNVVLSTSPTLVTPALGTPSAVVLTNGTGLPLTTGVTGVLPNANTTATPNATASTIMSRDANVNVKVNTVVENLTSTATAAGTTTLTAATSPLQQFTGTTTQTVRLPDATTLSIGYQITVLNRSTGVVTVNDNSSTLVQALNAGAQTTFTCTSVSTAAGTWDASTSSGSGSVAQYATYVVGTASGTYTGSTTVVNLPFAYVQDGKTLNFYYNGQELTPAVDYTETSATSITLATAMIAGARIMARANASSSTATAVTFLRENYIVGTPSGSYTGSTTVFNLTNTYTPGGTNLKMYVDGDLQTAGAGVDYLETSSSIVTSNNALIAGQKVSFIFSQSVAPAGTVGSGTSAQLAYYPATGSTIAGNPSITAESTHTLQIARDVAAPGDHTTSAQISLVGVSNPLKQMALGFDTTSNVGFIQSAIQSTSFNPTVINPDGGAVRIRGTDTNDSAATGFVGQYIESLFSGINGGATGVWADMTSISLTAGDWDVSLNVQSSTSAGTTTNVVVGIGTTAGNVDPSLGDGNNRAQFLGTIPATVSLCVPSYRMSLSATTTVYAKHIRTYTGTVPSAGRISARRVR